MRSGVIAQKVGMTRVYNDAGEHIPVTVLRLDNVQVVAQRTQEKNGYTAVQLGAGSSKVKNTAKALRGQFAAASVEPKAKLVEFRVSEDNLIEIGAELTASHFVAGQGLGRQLMRKLVKWAKTKKLDRLYGDVLDHNHAMLQLAQSLGFKRQREADTPGLVRVVLDLNE